MNGGKFQVRDLNYVTSVIAVPLTYWPNKLAPVNNNLINRPSLQHAGNNQLNMENAVKSHENIATTDGLDVI
jgi:hypothetical protein